MLTPELFEQAMQYTRTVGTNASYEDVALEMLWKGMTYLPESATIVEIGCEVGRSTSLILQAARVMNFQVIVIDPFVTHPPAEVAAQFMRNMNPIGVPFTLHMMTSKQAGWLVPDTMHMIHIDGDHSIVEADCRRYLADVSHIAAFHDYGTVGCPDVQPTVDKWTKGWEFIGLARRCYVARRP